MAYTYPQMTGGRDHQASMQRARVGMIGLAMVVLLIGIASAIMRGATREAPVGAAGAPHAAVVANMVADNAIQDAGEPLAELGVAPAANSQAASRSH